MKVLVLGGTGHLGTHLITQLQAHGGFQAVGASRHAGPGALRLDTCKEAALTQVLREVDAVVHAVAGSAAAIAQGARVLARAAQVAGVTSVVYVSSMAVYGDRQGPVDEATPPGHPIGWYAKAKQAGEAAMADLARAAGPGGRHVQVTVLRPGCIWGPGSALWVDRIARWLSQARVGDLGAAGDGWTHGVHVDDVCLAILRALQRPPVPGTLRTLNLASPDSPRWNTWFTDLALALGHTPLRRIHPLQLRADAWVLGPALHGTRHLLARLHAMRAARALPEAISPGLLRLWQSTLRMDASAAPDALGLEWTPYPVALRQCVASLTANAGAATGAGCEPPSAARVR